MLLVPTKHRLIASSVLYIYCALTTPISPQNLLLRRLSVTCAFMTCHHHAYGTGICSIISGQHFYCTRLHCRLVCYHSSNSWHLQTPACLAIHQSSHLNSRFCYTEYYASPLSFACPCAYSHSLVKTTAAIRVQTSTGHAATMKCYASPCSIARIARR